MSKREIADEVVDRLMADERAYQHDMVQLMVELADMQRFPRVGAAEDTDKWLPKAQAAVAKLKAHTAAYEDLISERERLQGERAAYTTQRPNCSALRRGA